MEVITMDMGKMLKQVQKMQQDMAKAQDELADQTVEATVGGGAVQVKANGKLEILSITIKKEVVDPEDIEMMQDLILSAINEALRKAQDVSQQTMSKITGGMNLPKIPGLF